MSKSLNFKSATQLSSWSSLIQCFGCVILLGLLSISATPVLAEKPVYELSAREVAYQADGVKMKGYLAFNRNATGPRPGVLVVHEWWGNNEYAHKRARMLSMLGYVALAVDMYGEGATATHPDDAGKFSSAVMSDMGTARARFEAALELLKQQPQVDPDRIAAIGYCFGGGVVLSMARMGVDLDAVVSFHGSLKTKHPAEEGAVKAKVLVCHGAKDPLVSEEDVAAFHREMKQAKADYQFISYPDALHAFTNPDADMMAKKFNLPLGYDAWADKSSWESMRQLLVETFKQ